MLFQERMTRSHIGRMYYSDEPDVLDDWMTSPWQFLRYPEGIVQCIGPHLTNKARYGRFVCLSSW